ncbi:MAG: hypothetical protein ACFCVD_21435 [Nodosilinea sp.]
MEKQSYSRKIELGWSRRGRGGALAAGLGGAAMVVVSGWGDRGLAQSSPRVEPPVMAQALLAQTYDIVPPLPAGAIPVPGEAFPQAPASGQQYVVVVNGDSPLLLDQVRVVEPTAFRTTFQGRSVIQAGRFSQSANAQQRVTDLAAQGIGAEMSEVSSAVPSYAQAPALPTNVYATNGDLPPLPTVTEPSLQGASEGSLDLPPVTTPEQVPQLPPTQTAVPPTQTVVPPVQTAVPPVQTAVPPTSGSVEFGQELTYGTPATPNAYPVSLPPPGGAALAEPSPSAASAPYYVIIPAREGDLPALSAQVIQLGTPADRVQQRTSPRGPHLAVGPFEDRGLANRWNDFYREAGIGNSRVYFGR